MPETSTSAQPSEPSPIPSIGIVTVHELWTCLKAGVADFRAAPQFGLFFSAVYVMAGFFMLWLGAGHVSWILATSLGFPLAARLRQSGYTKCHAALSPGRR
jgi:uncharacterized membrane protein